MYSILNDILLSIPVFDDILLPTPETWAAMDDAERAKHLREGHVTVGQWEWAFKEGSGEVNEAAQELYGALIELYANQ